MAVLRVELSASGVDTLVFNTNTQAQGLHVSSDAIKGWWSAPSVKTSTDERQTADGAHNVGQVLYSARTVTLPFHMVNYNHSEVMRVRGRIGSFMGRKDVRMTVYEDSDTRGTFATGYIQPEYSDIFQHYSDSGTITLVCTDPCRYDTLLQQKSLWTRSGGSQGLQWGDSHGGLVFPLNFGKVDYNTSNGNIANNGSYAAYPIFKLTGWFDWCTINWSDSNGTEGVLGYSGIHVQQIPFIINCRTRKASMDSLDTTSYLNHLQFPKINPGENLHIHADASAPGAFIVQLRNTYM